MSLLLSINNKYFFKSAVALFSCAFLLLDGQVAALASKPAGQPLPIAGTSSCPSLNGVDQVMVRLMNKFKISAGELAVSKNGKIVYSKAFGFADKEHKIPTKTANLFRIASCSKPITAVAIMSLVEQGKLGLEDKALDILADMKPPAGEPFDERLQQITVRQLLEHNSGFSNEDGDPQFSFLKIAAHKYNLPQPASAEAIVRYRFTRPLERAPLTKHEYSNFGYNVLGRIIEHKTGMNYENYVRKNILEPAGITDMVIGRVRAKDKLDAEVYYDDGEQGERNWSVYADELMRVAPSYGSGYTMESMDAHGGWLATAEDLVKFCAASDGSNPSCRLLKPATIEIMTDAPQFINPGSKKGEYYAKGWNVRSNRSEWNHSGALTWGVASLVCHLSGGVQVACVFNHLPVQLGGFFHELDSTVVAAVRQRQKDL
jgi:CubicO group peptidase (beta-lactamase class C family)